MISLIWKKNKLVSTIDSGGNTMIKRIFYNYSRKGDACSSTVRFGEEDKKKLHLGNYLVSTYVVCERLSVMHEPAGVVEILVQIPQNTPIL